MRSTALSIFAVRAQAAWTDQRLPITRRTTFYTVAGCRVTRPVVNHDFRTISRDRFEAATTVDD